MKVTAQAIHDHPFLMRSLKISDADLVFYLPQDLPLAEAVNLLQGTSADTRQHSYMPSKLLQKLVVVGDLTGLPSGLLYLIHTFAPLRRDEGDGHLPLVRSGWTQNSKWWAAYFKRR